MPPVYDFVAGQIDRLELSLLSNIMDQGLERIGIHVTTEGRKTVASENSIGHFFFRFGFAKLLINPTRPAARLRSISTHLMLKSTDMGGHFLPFRPSTARNDPKNP